MWNAYILAWNLKCPLEAVLSMSLDTFYGWLAFLELRDEDVRRDERIRGLKKKLAQSGQRF